MAANPDPCAPEEAALRLAVANVVAARNDVLQSWQNFETYLQNAGLPAAEANRWRRQLRGGDMPSPSQTYVAGVPADVWAAADLVNQRRAQLAAANDARRAAQAAFNRCRQENPLPAAPAPAQPAPVQPAPPPDGQSAPEPGAEGDGAAVPSLSSLLCGMPRVGHGHEGDPCRVRLGEDGVCQYHG